MNIEPPPDDATREKEQLEEASINALVADMLKFCGQSLEDDDMQYRASEATFKKAVKGLGFSQSQDLFYTFQSEVRQGEGGSIRSIVGVLMSRFIKALPPGYFTCKKNDPSKTSRFSQRPGAA